MKFWFKTGTFLATFALASCGSSDLNRSSAAEIIENQPITRGNTEGAALVVPQQVILCLIDGGYLEPNIDGYENVPTGWANVTASGSRYFMEGGLSPSTQRESTDLFLKISPRFDDVKVTGIAGGDTDGVPVIHLDENLNHIGTSTSSAGSGSTARLIQFDAGVDFADGNVELPFSACFDDLRGSFSTVATKFDDGWRVVNGGTYEFALGSTP